MNRWRAWGIVPAGILATCVSARPEPDAGSASAGAMPAAGDSVHQLEPHLVRTSDGHLLGAYIEFRPDPDPRTGFMSTPGSFGCGVAMSTDNGLSWHALERPFAGQCGDPWLAADDGGGAVLAVSGAGPGGLRVAQWSPESGWRTLLERDGSLDHPTVHMYGDTVLIAGTPLRGQPVFIRLAPGTAADEVAIGFPDRPQHVDTPVLNAAGEVLVTLTDFAGLWVVMSTDGGRTFDAPVQITEECRAPFNHAMTIGIRVYVACIAVSGTVHLYASVDGGTSWRREWQADGTPHGTPTLAAGASRSVLVWQDASRGCPSLMMVPIEQDMDAVVPEVLAATAECGSGFDDYPSERFPWGGDYIGAVIVQETRATRRARVVVAWPVRQDSVYRVVSVARTLR